MPTWPGRSRLPRRGCRRRLTRAAVQHVQVAIDALDIARVRPFWQAVLGYAAAGDEDLLDAHRQGPTFWFQQMESPIDKGTSDLEQMMGDVLDAVLVIFRCDRAWLLYPCDPEADSLRVPAERTRPEYVDAWGAGVDIPNEPEVADISRRLLASDGPVRFDPESASCASGRTGGAF